MNAKNVLCFLLGNYQASGVYMPTFRKTLFHLHRQVDVSRISTHIYLPMKMEQTECSERSAYKIQMPGSYPKESIQHTEHGESLKSRMQNIFIRHFKGKSEVFSVHSMKAYRGIQI